MSDFWFYLTVVNQFATLAGTVAGLLYISYQMRALHLSTNSRMDQLLDVTRLSAKAEGNLAGRAEQKLEPKG